jgi:hypothetical protein
MHPAVSATIVVGKDDVSASCRRMTMPRFVTRLAPFHGARSLRVTVTWRKARIQRISFDYAKPHLLRRLLEGARW